MDEKNNRQEDDHQDYHDDFDDDFEIGIPINQALSTTSASDTEESSPEHMMVSGTDEETASQPDTVEPGDTEAEKTGEPPEEDNFSREDTDNESSDEESLIPGPLDEIKAQLRGLSREFESKLKYDEHKNKIIDDLHQALQEYREGLVKKYLHRIITDIIKIVDDMRKFTSHYKTQPEQDESTDKLLKYIENIASDLEDLFSWEGVVPFNCDGEMVDLNRQRILKKIETDDPEKDKTIAERLRPGYEWDGKVIRPEMVSAYVYQTDSTAEDNNN